MVEIQVSLGALNLFASGASYVMMRSNFIVERE